MRDALTTNRSLFGPGAEACDLLPGAARTPLARTFSTYGLQISLETNFEPLLEIWQSHFGRANDACRVTKESDTRHSERSEESAFRNDLEKLQMLRPPRRTQHDKPRVPVSPVWVTGGDADGARIRTRIWVDPTGSAATPLARPHFRAVGHLVFAGFEARSALLINLQQRLVFGRFNVALAADSVYWRRIVLPVMIGALGPSLGLTILHTACVTWEGNGLFLAGESGAGKSTLALALSETGFDFLTDDRTVIFPQGDCLLASPLGHQLKLRRDALRHFPELALSPDGEEVVYLNPYERSGREPGRSCAPRWIVFLRRQAEPVFEIRPITAERAATLLEEGLPVETPQVEEQQRQAIRAVAECDLWELRFGGSPHTVATRLKGFLVEREGLSGRPLLKQAATSIPVAPTRPDPLRRFAATPLAAQFHLMDRQLRLETNSSAVLRQATALLGHPCEGSAGSNQLLWRIVTEGDPSPQPPWPEMTAFSHGASRYVSLGRRSFVTVDPEARLVAGRLAESLAQDEAGFEGILMPLVFYLSARTLGLTTLVAACVAKQGRGLLVFGEPGSGKTTASYVASKLGLEFVSDEAVFLEPGAAGLRAWGDFWPAKFRLEGVRHFPELAVATRRLNFYKQTLLNWRRDPMSRNQPLRPVACVFLERESVARPHLISIDRGEHERRLCASLPFGDDAGPQDMDPAVLRALLRLPAYRLAYGGDPGDAGPLFLRLLTTANSGGRYP